MKFNSNKRVFVGARVFYREHAFAQPNHSFATCYDLTEAKKERSVSFASLCAVPLRICIIGEFRQVLLEHGDICGISVTCDGAVLLWQW